MTLLRTLFTLLLFQTAIGFSRPPVDISFLIVDYKYSQNQGLKICEIQTGNVSAFSAYDSTYEEKFFIPKLFSDVMERYKLPLWSSSRNLCCKTFVQEFKKRGWKVYNTPPGCLDDAKLRAVAKKSIQDPYSIASYEGILYLRPSQIRPLNKFLQEHPSIVIMDYAFFPFKNNKATFDKLFQANATLNQYRPKSGIYKKRYTKTLANEIINDLQCDKVVIKPTRASLGHGVIIVEAKHLDKTLKLITKNRAKLKKSKDQAYKYWARDFDSYFLVEEFAHSDPLPIAHLKGKSYDPTFRTAFFLVYDQETIQFIPLEHLVKLPEKSLMANGTLNDKHKTVLKHPYYAQFPEELRAPVENELEKALTLFYSDVLDYEEN